jgi:hypothetical protein
MRPRFDPRDEIMLRNNITTSTVAVTNMTRSVGGSFINTVDVVT